MTIKEALDQIAQDLQLSQKGLINKGGELQAYKTGQLHNTLKVETKQRDEVTSIVTDVPFYGVFVNDGTWKMKARPFVQASVESVLNGGGYKLLSDAGIDEIKIAMDKELKPITIKN